MRRWLQAARGRLEGGLYMRRLHRDLRTRGWSSVATWDDRAEQFWEYTVGFDESLNQPEIIVGGLPPYHARGLFGPMHAALRYGCLQIDEGMRFAWTEPTPTSFARSSEASDPRGLRVFQLVLPDAAGLMPWEPGHDPAQRLRTPELWRPPQQQGCGGSRPMRGHARQIGR